MNITFDIVIFDQFNNPEGTLENSRKIQNYHNKFLIPNISKR